MGRLYPEIDDVGNHSHSCKFAGIFFVPASITVKIPRHGTGGKYLGLAHQFEGIASYLYDIVKECPHPG